MRFLKTWWPLFTSAGVLIIGTFMLVGDSVLAEMAQNGNGQNVLMLRTAALGLQLALSAATGYAVWKLWGALSSLTDLQGSNGLILGLIMAAVTDTVLGLVLTVIGWSKIDAMLAVAGAN